VAAGSSQSCIAVPLFIPPIAVDWSEMLEHGPEFDSKSSQIKWLALTLPYTTIKIQTLTSQAHCIHFRVAGSQ
jgi:hypothetical protein